MDKGMKKSALCETGRVPGRVDRNIEAGTAVYFPGGGAAEVIESPEDCARDWNVKLGPHVIGTHLDTSAYIEDLDGFFDRIEAKNKVELRKAIKKRLSL